MDIEKIINYWLKSAENDFEVAKSLFKNNYYLYSLFFCHLTIEKILKALVVKTTVKHAPYTHNLSELAEKSGMELNKDKLDFLDSLTNFNLEARYPDFKFEAYKKVDKNLAENYLNITQEIYLWIKKMI